MDNINAYVTNVVSEEIDDKQFDIVLFNRTIQNFGITIDEARKKWNCKVVMDIDDDWELPPNHIMYHGYETIKPIIEQNLRDADMVTCTGQRLADKISLFNSNVHIHKNALPYGEHQFLPDKIHDDRVRIFWCGSVTHEPDLNILKNPMKRLHTIRDKVRMVIGGYNDSDSYSKSVWDRMFSSFTCGGTLENFKLKGLMPDEYMEMYEYADICVIPLEDGLWHSCKSNLKILESACKKVPVIVSNVQPYSLDTDAPVFFVNKQSDWFDNMKYLVLNENARKDYGEKLYEWAKQNYDYWKINADRRTAYENLITA
jgi:glycosyltransferase involved in cell wall biosynthesis